MAEMLSTSVSSATYEGQLVTDWTAVEEVVYVPRQHHVQSWRR